MDRVAIGLGTACSYHSRLLDCFVALNAPPSLISQQSLEQARGGSSCKPHCQGSLCFALPGAAHSFLLRRVDGFCVRLTFPLSEGAATLAAFVPGFVLRRVRVARIPCGNQQPCHKGSRRLTDTLNSPVGPGRRSVALLPRLLGNLEPCRALGARQTRCHMQPCSCWLAALGVTGPPQIQPWDQHYPHTC